jgi:hypothetical protein
MKHKIPLLSVYVMLVLILTSSHRLHGQNYHGSWAWPSAGDVPTTIPWFYGAGLPISLRTDSSIEISVWDWSDWIFFTNVSSGINIDAENFGRNNRLGVTTTYISGTTIAYGYPTQRITGAHIKMNLAYYSPIPMATYFWFQSSSSPPWGTFPMTLAYHYPSAVAHEIGHALGLDHDIAGIMIDGLPYNTVRYVYPEGHYAICITHGPGIC